MLALYLLLVATVWFIVSVTVAILIARKLPVGRWRVALAFALAILLVTLPFDDQIVGGMQFRKLCEDNSFITVEREKAKGRTVYLADTPMRQVRGMWLRVAEKEWRFVDVSNGETVVSYREFHAGPRLLHVAPMLVDDHCAPGGRVNNMKLLRELGVTEVDRRAVGAR